jgi:hypothetical protein
MVYVAHAYCIASQLNSLPNNSPRDNMGFSSQRSVRKTHREGQQYLVCAHFVLLVFCKKKLSPFNVLSIVFV